MAKEYLKARENLRTDRMLQAANLELRGVFVHGENFNEEPGETIIAPHHCLRRLHPFGGDFYRSIRRMAHETVTLQFGYSTRHARELNSRGCRDITNAHRPTLRELKNVLEVIFLARRECVRWTHRVRQSDRDLFLIDLNCWQVSIMCSRC